MNGTVQEVYAQALQMNPDFEPPVSKRNAAAAGSIQLIDRSLNKRNVICGNFASADKRRILEGIAYLNNLPAGDRPTNGPGPRTCGRVSCSYNAAIWWCNDVSKRRTNRCCSTFLPPKPLQSYTSRYSVSSLMKTLCGVPSYRIPLLRRSTDGSTLPEAPRPLSTLAHQPLPRFRVRASSPATGIPLSAVTVAEKR